MQTDVIRNQIFLSVEGHPVFLLSFSRCSPLTLVLRAVWTCREQIHSELLLLGSQAPRTKDGQG